MKAKIVFIFVIFLLSSCSFFKVIPEKDYTTQSIKQYEDRGKCLILHRGEEAWRAYDLTATIDDSGMITRVSKLLKHVSLVYIWTELTTSGSFFLKY